MFRFADPYYFLALTIIPVLILYRRYRGGLPCLMTSTLEPVAGIRESIFVKGARSMPVLKYIALALLISGIARPQWGTREVVIKTKGINIILAVDLSGSMAALDFRLKGRIVNRLDAIKDVIEKFISKRNGDRIGMVVFGTNAYTQLPLTRDYSTISSVLNRLKIGAAGQHTAIGDAIGISIKRLRDIKSKSNIIILLTDGSSNSGELSPETAVELAAQAGIKIYTIGVGTKGKAPFLVHSPIFGDHYVYQQVDMDEGVLKDIAGKTGGLYFRAQDVKGLEKIYLTINRLEKTDVDVKTFDNYRELYIYFLIPAFSLLCLWILLTNTRFLRVP